MAAPAARRRSNRSRTRPASGVRDMSQKINPFSRNTTILHQGLSKIHGYDTHSSTTRPLMFRLRTAPLAAAVLVLAGCATNQPSVPLVGRCADIAALAGEWTGEYSSSESGRSGSITFTLRAAADSAFGDVVMIPVGWGRPLMPWRQDAALAGARQPQPEVLTISFVRVQAGHVTGTLAPYADSTTGARLVTTFAGELANTITGTYTTRLPSGDTQVGRWTVQRK